MGGPVKRPTGSWRVEPLASLRADWTGLVWSWILLSKKNCDGRIGTTERLAPGRLDSCARTDTHVCSVLVSRIHALLVSAPLPAPAPLPVSVFGPLPYAPLPTPPVIPYDSALALPHRRLVRLFHTALRPLFLPGWLPCLFHTGACALRLLPTSTSSWLLR
jgi:hypothetical protein